MKRIFITGMSGVGKSSVIDELKDRGYGAIDTDYDDWCELANVVDEPEWIWCEDRMRELLTSQTTGPLFVSGCVINQRNFYQYFDHKVLLSAPLKVMEERIQSRTENPYGKSAQEWAEICENYAWVQPLLRQSADIELDTTTQTVADIADFLVELASR